MRVVGSDHLAIFTTLEDKTEEIVTLATSDHLLANIDDWQSRALVLNRGAFNCLIGVGHRNGGRCLVGGYGGSQSSKGQQKIALFHFNIPVSYVVISALYRCSLMRQSAINRL